MKIEELRIGNLLEWNKNDFKVCSIHKNGIENELWIKPLNELHGIPITEDWLLKFGFWFIKNSSSRYSYRDGYYCHPISDVWISKDFYLCLDIYYPEGMLHIHKEALKYVHELQNIYHALTGEELI